MAVKREAVNRPRGPGGRRWKRRADLIPNLLEDVKGLRRRSNTVSEISQRRVPTCLARILS